ncbi:hypothetical protein C0J52_05570 [Blattella germanica]|nr:hypothetical protein C0J52_05570 [Blattella germanica]
MHMGVTAKIMITLALICIIYVNSEVAPTNCKNNNECSSNHCCLLGHYHGAEPQCVPAPQENDSCRPGQASVNTTIYSHDGKPKYEAINVYNNVCPCGQGLTCDTANGGACKKSS